jgi:hypothetical protein
MAQTITNFTIPLQGIAQSFTIDLAGTTYTLTLKWNDEMASMDPTDTGWTLDIGDEDQNPLACNIPLITGADLLSGLEYLGIGGSLVVFTDGDPTAVPDFDDLGDSSNLYFQTVTNS